MRVCLLPVRLISLNKIICFLNKYKDYYTFMISFCLLTNKEYLIRQLIIYA